MTERELHRLKRGELLEMMLAQSREIESLRARVRQLEEQLADREIRIQESGSIAEAALKLNGIFEAAQAAADQYLENVKKQKGEQPG
ncbi:MAG: DNA repair protein [Sarcina sp.]|nr:DNA repair protein [Sarcina sp.]